MLRNFTRGQTSESDCPNLGHRLVTVLISDDEISEKTIKSIIREAITRNVVWVLDKRGTDMSELSYIERSSISDYRLQRKFEASRTIVSTIVLARDFRGCRLSKLRRCIAN